MLVNAPQEHFLTSIMRRHTTLAVPGITDLYKGGLFALKHPLVSLIPFLGYRSILSPVKHNLAFIRTVHGDAPLKPGERKAVNNNSLHEDFLAVRIYTPATIPLPF